jgi:hypothetical protein
LNAIVYFWDLLELQQDLDDCTSLVNNLVNVAECKLNKDVAKKVGSFAVSIFNHGQNMIL